jgi:NADPH:quinone reductase-like Zn-dependent oxidoreductase
MKAFIVDRYKSKDGLRFGDTPDPELRDEDVMVQVHAASVNPLDPKIRDGEFKFILAYRLPLALGNDLAGVVVRVRPKVRGFEPGDRVYARPNQDRIGTLLEFISMNEARGVEAEEPHHGGGGLASAGRPDRLAGAG